METQTKNYTTGKVGESLYNRNKFRLMGLDMDDIIKYFFAGNAWVAIIVLILITISLFKEGLWFFPMHQEVISIYRQAGLEYVDKIREFTDGHSDLTQAMTRKRITLQKSYSREGIPESTIKEKLAEWDAFQADFAEAITPVREVMDEMGNFASNSKTEYFVAQDMKTAIKVFADMGDTEMVESLKSELVEPDLKAANSNMLLLRPKLDQSFVEYKANVTRIVEEHQSNDPKMIAAMQETKRMMKRMDTMSETVKQKLDLWNPDRPVSIIDGFTYFLFGSKWVTQSFWQDFFGLVPLFMGSFLVSLVALLASVPFGVAAAIYVNQIATKTEQNLIKPYIEFISAIPSVVLGFFGIAVLGEGIRLFSQGFPGYPFLQDIAFLWTWLPFFPISERLNILTAGLLLAIMTVPTIFTLAEDALNNVPMAYKEAAYALGANRMQAIVRIIIPASLSGIISAIILGFGRVIGETMVVLLCAGNRIQIPDFTQGIGAIAAPVHTMTGLIAQEIPEVDKGSIHYRALFMVCIVLFIISLILNYIAQQVVKRYKISIG